MTSDSDNLPVSTPVFIRIKIINKSVYMTGSKGISSFTLSTNVANNFKPLHKSYAQMAKNNSTSYGSSNQFTFKKPAKNKKNKNTPNKPDDTPYQDLGDYKEESIFHWYKGEAHKKNLKKLCFGGSDYMIGCPWEQFGNDKHNGIKFITSQISDCASAVYNKFAKTTYFIFEEKEHAAKFLNAKHFHNGKSVELFGTIKHAEEVTIIKVPQLKFVRLKSAIRSICEMLEKHCEVKEICARVKKNTSVLLPFGIQILLVENENAEIPNFIEIEDEIIGFFLEREDLRKSKKNKNSKAKEPEPGIVAAQIAEKNEAPKTTGMSHPILAKENLATPTANKSEVPIIATKPAIPASVKSQNDTAQTPTKPATDRKLAIPIYNLKDKKPTAAGKKIDLKGAIASAISTNKIPHESSDIDVDITGESENANSSGMDIDSSEIEVKKEPDSSQDGYHTQDS
ncbi:hypothetical protein AYI70_g7776, partial [Smittium culicis]